MAEPLALPTNPTNSDLAKAIMQSHECIDGLRSEFQSHVKLTAKDLKLTRTQIRLNKDTTKQIKNIVDNIAIEQAKVKNALGVEKAKKPIGMLSQTRLIVTLVGAATVAGGIWRFVEFMFPTFIIFFKQLHLYIMR